MAKKTQELGNPIVFVGGDKGGVGKSIVAITFIEYLLSNNKPVALIDTDMTNPDVHKIYKSSFDSAVINLEQEDGKGWNQVIEFCEKHADATVVINLKAGAGESIKLNKEAIGEMLSMLGRPLDMFFTLGIQRQCYVLFKETLDTFPAFNAVVAVKNLKNGDDDDFFNWQQVKALDTFKDVYEMTIPKISARISLAVTDDGQMISEIMNDPKIPIAYRGNLKPWLRKIHAAYDDLQRVLCI